VVAAVVVAVAVVAAAVVGQLAKRFSKQMRW
jgi:hypothetical protein